MSVGMLERLKKIKGIGYIVLALVAGLALLIIGGNGEPSTPVADPGADYVAAAEAEIAALGKKVCGVSTSAAVSLSAGYTYSYAADQRVRTSYNADGTVAEKEIEQELRQVSTNGGTALVPVRETPPRVNGVAVVCPGAEASRVQTLKRLIMALYSLEETAVFVTN